MKEHPILYSTPMIQAKLAGRKTQTRRVMKVQPENDCYFEMKVLTDVVGNAVCLIDYNQGDKNPYVRCPYGNIGDILWARETFCKDIDVEGGFLYRATNPEAECEDGDGSPWKPSIHMPKSAARIWERITDIRVERLQDISEEDAIAEGIEKHWYDDHFESPGRDLYFVTGVTKEGFGYPSAIEAYKNLWESINGSGSWELNPLVWVITAEIISTTGRQNAGLAVSKTETKN